MHITTARQLNLQQPETHTPSSSNRLHRQVSCSNNTPEEIIPLISLETPTRSTPNKSHIDWFKAANTNNIEMIKSLIESGVDVNLTGPNNLTALVHVLFGNLEGEPNFEIAWEIFQAKNFNIEVGVTGRHLTILQALKLYQDRNRAFNEDQKNKKTSEANVSPDKSKPDIDVFTEYYSKLEIEQWQEASGHILRSPELTVDQRIWFEAIELSDTKKINELIKNPLNINRQDHLNRTALWLAAYKGDVILIETLLASDGLIINEETAGEFHNDLSELRDRLNSGEVERKNIRKVLTKLIPDPYPSVYAELLEKIGGTSPQNTSTINRLTQSFISAICVKTGFRS